MKITRRHLCSKGEWRSKSKKLHYKVAIDIEAKRHRGSEQSSNMAQGRGPSITRAYERLFFLTKLSQLRKEKDPL